MSILNREKTGSARRLIPESAHEWDTLSEARNCLEPGSVVQLRKDTEREILQARVDCRMHCDSLVPIERHMTMLPLRS